MHHQVLSIQPISCAINSIHATQTFVLRISPKSLNILMWSHSSMHTKLYFFKSLNHPQTEFSFILVFIVNIYLKFCFIHVVKFHLFENYSLIFTPFLFSHLFSFPPLPYFPCFPFISWFGDKFSIICENIFKNLEDFLDFCKCNKSFDFDLCNPFWTMNQP